jgi:hypothetical protein
VYGLFILLAVIILGMLRSGLMLSILFVTPAAADELPLFDTHLHYNKSYTEEFPPNRLIEILERNKISHALITSRPPELVQTLRQQAPGRIIPLLGAYRELQDKENWYQDVTQPIRLAEQLESNNWYGIGELHIFAPERHSPIFHKVVSLAAEHELPLLMHADPAVIDTIYEWEPELTVIWAHAGTYPYPDLLADYLQRYPYLFVDLSVREDRISPHGKIADRWYELFVHYPDRFLVGVDTFSKQRWNEYGLVANRIRGWLSQLPEDIADKLAYQNARRIFRSGLDKTN